jgi:hypothetical protein
MSDAATLLPETLPAALAEDWARPMVERQLQVLGRLAEAGLEIAVALEAQAKGGEPVAEGDLAMAYNRVARAVRQTVMLQARLIEALREQAEGRAGRKAAARASATRLVRGVIGDGDDALGDDDGGGDAERAERLRAEAAERLEREDFGDLLARPFSEVVAGICRDLGLSPDWLTLAEDCAVAEAALRGEAEAAAEPEPSGPLKIRWLDSPAPSRDSS